ncbi:hypothetical protein [Micromonospora halophytica]|uniref:Uncharacterized protein n=1 Tax=Micromonospora halophytica TaxID=47864 RepID=A0A1C5IP35_9ACTN|nr:hypothetical protein [Micromonospora halophytica]SCG60088.1 hypothetical protein GA0070560_114102 [Micromonospora halophytica]
MGVTDALARVAVRRAHVLVVQTPEHWLTRVVVERHVLARSWRLAMSPADADVLVVCGAPGRELARVVTHLWDQMPGPRSRVQVDGPEVVVPALDTAESELLDSARQRIDSRDRPHARSPKHGSVDEPPTNHAMEEGGHGHRDSGPQAHHSGADAGPPADMGSTDHGGSDHGGMDHGGMDHGGMDHGGMEMAPAGIPLAQGGEDRDGLELDVLHLELGPVLAYWPAGLILTCALQGDVIVEAEARLVDADPSSTPGHPGPPDPLRQAARRCDNVRNLLALAGSTDAASRVRHIRDSLLTDRDADRAAAELDRLRRSVRRSWLLRWSLRRLRFLTDRDLARHRLPAHLRGDTHDRLLTMLDRAAHSLAATAAEPDACGRHTTAVDGIADVVRGLDLATARLVVASLDLDALTVQGEVNRV